MNKVKLLAVAFAVLALSFSGAQAGKVEKKVKCRYNSDGLRISNPIIMKKSECKNAEWLYNTRFDSVEFLMGKFGEITLEEAKEKLQKEY